MDMLQHLRTHIVHKTLHLPVHLLHALAHLQNDRDAGDIDPEVARQIQDELEAFQVFVGIEARVSLGPGGFQQPFPLVKPEGLRVDLYISATAEIM